MSNMELLMEGLKLLVFGMGFVCLFLVLMVYCMKLLQFAVKPFSGLFPESAPAAPSGKKAASDDDARLAAVAATAVEIFRQGGKQPGSEPKTK